MPRKQIKFRAGADQPGPGPEVGEVGQSVTLILALLAMPLKCATQQQSVIDTCFQLPL